MSKVFSVVSANVLAIREGEVGYIVVRCPDEERAWELCDYIGNCLNVEFEQREHLVLMKGDAFTCKNLVRRLVAADKSRQGYRATSIALDYLTIFADEVFDNEEDAKVLYSKLTAYDRKFIVHNVKVDNEQKVRFRTNFTAMSEWVWGYNCEDLVRLIVFPHYASVS